MRWLYGLIYFFFLFFYAIPCCHCECAAHIHLLKRRPEQKLRHPINHNLADDILTQTWFIVMLGSIIAIIIFSFIGMALIKRIQFIKQTSLTNIHGTYILFFRRLLYFSDWIDMYMSYVLFRFSVDMKSRILFFPGVCWRWWSFRFFFAYFGFIAYL